MPSEEVPELSGPWSAGAQAALEAWIEHQVVRYGAEQMDALRASPEAFAEAAALEPGTPHPLEVSRAQLAARLRLVAGIEQALGEPSGVHPGHAAGAAPIPGLDLEGFDLLEQIGQGGMGLVFRAREKALGREVAIKVPRFGSSLDPRERARFEREAQAVAQLRHPGIVTLHRVGRSGEQAFLVMEHVAGRSLAAILRDLRSGVLPRAGASLRRNGRTYEQAVAELGIEVLEAVEAAHREGILHRDLKPANVLIEPDARARIVDFGLARFADGDGLTHSGELLGTPDYLAPEVLRNPRAASPASDVYAFGVMLYELLSLARPFGDHTPEVVMARALAGEAPPLASRARIPRALSAIVEKAMAADPGHRYASARALAADLSAYLEGRQVTARPSTLLAQIGRRLARRPVQSSLGAVALLLAGSLGLVWIQGREVQAATDRRKAQDLVRAALFMDQADARTGGGASERSSGREESLRMLAQALELEPSLDEARLHRAVLLYELGRGEEFSSTVSELAAARASQVMGGWLQAAVVGSSNFFHPPQGALPEEAGPAECFYWARSRTILYHRTQGEDRKRVRAEILATFTRLRSDPLYAPAALYLSGVVCMTGDDADHARAVGYLRAAQALIPEHPIAIANLAAMLQRWFLDLVKAGATEAPQDSTELQEAQALLAPALERTPEYEILWTNEIAILADSLGDGARAAETCRHGLEYHPESASLHFMLGQLLKTEMFGLGDLESPAALAKGAEARVHLEQAVEIDPRDSLKWFQLANLHYLMDDPEGTLANLDEALARGLPKDRQATVETMQSWAREALAEESADKASSDPPGAPADR